MNRRSKNNDMQILSVTSNFDCSSLSKLLQEKVDPYLLGWDDADYFPMDVFRQLHQCEIMTVGLPLALGGSGSPMMALMGIAETMAFHSSGLTASWLANLLAQTAISRFATAAVAQTVIREHLNSQSVLSFCATERESGFDIARLKTVARPVENGYLLSGEKYFITNINYAAHLVVFAKVARSANDVEPGVSAFIVDAKSAGIRKGEPLKKLGQRESDTGQIFFEDVFIPHEHLLGRVGDGYKIVECCLSRTKTLLAATAVGICRRAETEAVNYLLRTVRYGEPLLARREIQNILSSLRVKREASWLLGCQSAAIWDEKETAVYASSVAKHFAADAAVETVDEALELTGGSGYLRENFLSKLQRDVKVLEIYEGSTLVLNAVIGRELFAGLLKSKKESVSK
jgi:acyl-CoA dehydrogenase